jgi:hypothetical protein
LAERPILGVELQHGANRSEERIAREWGIRRDAEGYSESREDFFDARYDFADGAEDD